MKTIELTDELANKLHTLYEHIDKDKHYVCNDDDIELTYELAKEYHKQNK